MIYHLPHKRLILASASPARQKMLADAGVECTACPAHVDEDGLKQAARAEGMTGLDAASLIAGMKAQKISAAEPDAFVIGSDQLLVEGEDWYSKPESRDDAAATLKALAGKTHQLVTAAVIYEGGRRLWHYAESPRITIRDLTDDDIEMYIRAMGEMITATPGVYMMERLGAQIITKIDGCPYAVLGLPLLQVMSFLRQHGLTLKDAA